jgi:hypothetical protein
MLKTPEGYKHIKGSPFKLVVSPATPDWSKAACSSISEWSVAGLPSSFTVSVKDRFGNLARLVQDEQFDIKVTSPDTSVKPLVSLKDNDNGTYTVEYICFRVGQHDICVKYGDKVLASATFTVKHGMK